MNCEFGNCSVAEQFIKRGTLEVRKQNIYFKVAKKTGDDKHEVDLLMSEADNISSEITELEETIRNTQICSVCPLAVKKESLG